ncbi:hypothetical protein [Mahella sp.]|uniref:hypothetical protein n=1 Tax=Mahella sp. TaxID=2798721 RepID=UPI0025C278E0|nr:hypothetical protein [Mahella sp.]
MPKETVWIYPRRSVTVPAPAIILLSLLWLGASSAFSLAGATITVPVGVFVVSDDSGCAGLLAGGACGLTSDTFLSNLIVFPSLVAIIVPDSSIRHITLRANLIRGTDKGLSVPCGFRKILFDRQKDRNL